VAAGLARIRHIVRGDCPPPPDFWSRSARSSSRSGPEVTLVRAERAGHTSGARRRPAGSSWSCGSLRATGGARGWSRPTQDGDRRRRPPCVETR